MERGERSFGRRSRHTRCAAASRAKSRQTDNSTGTCMHTMAAPRAWMICMPRQARHACAPKHVRRRSELQIMQHTLRPRPPADLLQRHLPLRGSHQLNRDAAHAHVPHCHCLRLSSERVWHERKPGAHDGLGRCMAHLQGLTAR